MHTRLLLLIALALAAPAMAFDGPTPAVRPPPVLRPPGSQALPPLPGATNPPGQPGALPPPSVSRARDARYPPASTVPTIYSSARPKPDWAVRILRPASAEKTAWETCEGLVLANVTSPDGLHPETLASAKRMTDEQWKCAYERLMSSCYIFQKARTKDASGLARSREENSDFRADMERRSKKVCASVTTEGDAQQVIDAMVDRAVWHSYQPATQANFNRALLDEVAPPPAPDVLKAMQRQAKLASAPKLTTAGRETQRPSDVEGLPRKALDKCWDATVQCLNNIPGSASWSDPVYQCARWRGAERCAMKGSRYSNMNVSDDDYRTRWGGIWTSDSLSETNAFADKWKRHCATAVDAGANPDPHVAALFAKCDSLWTSMFRL
ncbi:hypothetical protein [Myxococcus sp. AS-1-15]|uniref:hypothetical protein n=1 Tax=Myxococcus sp. AS-1-15 TaxID=2874600 RepID=UPI001CBFC2C0|nr:hypothetical protein [Myxococcus sp. AS-1-15]MBZ4402014.1 hypothetical protein [Myxococcus sp. AS-1-15]